MKFDRTGIILYVLNYKGCVTFYENIIGLRKMFETDMLTCFEFGSSYLMVEQDDEFEGEGVREDERSRTCLRMNLPDVKAVAERLHAVGVEVDYQEHSWGTVAKFRDPDGNLCAFKDSGTFEQQIREHQMKQQS